MKNLLIFILLLPVMAYSQYETHLNIKGQGGMLYNYDRPSGEEWIPHYQYGIDFHVSPEGENFHVTFFSRLNGPNNQNGRFEFGVRVMYALLRDFEEKKFRLGPTMEFNFSDEGEWGYAGLNFIPGIMAGYRFGAFEITLNGNKNLNIVATESAGEGEWMLGLGLSVDVSTIWKK
jgi:hypothetical protein